MKYFTLSTSIPAVLQAAIYTADLSPSALKAAYNGNQGTLSQGKPVDITARSVLLQAHNEIRDDAASGSLNGNKKASKLPLLAWDDELEKSAQAYAELCNWQHSKPAGFNALPYTYGENLYVTSAFGVSDASLAINSWGSEHMHYNHVSNTCAAGEQCGHYTQIVSEDTTRVGCGIAECSNVNGIGWGGGTVIVCQYFPPGKDLSENPYTYASTQAGQSCPNGTDSVFSSLCKDNDPGNSICQGDTDRCPAAGTCAPDAALPEQKYTCDCAENYEGKWCEDTACVDGTVEDKATGPETWIWEDGQPVYFQEHEKQQALDYCTQKNVESEGSCVGLTKRNYMIWHFWYPLALRTTTFEDMPGGQVLWLDCAEDPNSGDNSGSNGSNDGSNSGNDSNGDGAEDSGANDNVTYNPDDFSLELHMVGLDGKIRLGTDYDVDLNNKCIGLNPFIKNGVPKPWHYNSEIQIQDCIGPDETLPYEFDHQGWIYDEIEGTICTAHRTQNMVQKDFRYCILSNYKQGGNRPLKLMELNLAEGPIRYGFQFDFEAGQIVGRHSDPKEVVCWKEDSDDLWVKKMRTNSHFGSVQMHHASL